jgi:hypothetical protein
MAIRPRLRQVIERISRPSLATDEGDDTTVEQQQAEKWLEAMQAGRLKLPSDRRDVAAAARTTYRRLASWQAGVRQP